MILTPTEISGVVHVAVEPHGDERGLFARTFCAREFAAAGMRPVVAQANASFSFRAGTLRGLHFQRPPAAEAKLVRCTPAEPATIHQHSSLHDQAAPPICTPRVAGAWLSCDFMSRDRCCTSQHDSE